MASPLPMAVPLPTPEVSLAALPVASPLSDDPLGEPTNPLPPLPSSEDLLSAAPAWLLSAIIHMLLMIALGLSWVTTDDAAKFVLSLSFQDDGGEDFQTGDIDVPINLDAQPLEAGDSLEPLQLPTGEPAQTSGADLMPVAPLGLVAAEDAPAIRIALTGREAGMKASLLRAYGGTSSTEIAVTEALRWLARKQRKDGLWSLKGGYTDGASTENRDAATALALLAFQGAGITPDGDVNAPFTSVVKTAWTAFLKRQNEDGNFFNEGASNSRLYTHALATIALCELYGMTQDTRYRDRAQKAIDYCVKIQSAEGGWRYSPGSDADLSVTGWFVMALQSARMAGLEVPSLTFSRVGDFLETVSQDDGAQYSYTPGQGKKISMTAEGLLCRQYLGWPQKDKRLKRGVAVILEDLPTLESGRTHVYYWYYAAQVCHHMEGEPWRKWNAAMRDVVPALQVHKGKERGSWDPNKDDTTGVNGGGRLFVTCLSACMLEVYYRHLPIYQLEALKGVRH
jgi:hypothetical protein